METFGHVRMVIGFILSLSIAHLLKGTAKFIQHPNREKPYWIHLAWVFYIFILLVQKQLVRGLTLGSLKD